MVAKNIALGIVLLLVVATTVTAVDDICVKQTKQTYVQTAYSQYYPKLAVPDTRINFPALDYFAVIKGFRKEDRGWGERLNTRVFYCDKRTNKIVADFEMYPGSYKTFPDPLGYPSMTYEGPIPAAPNVRCRVVGQQAIVASPLNKLFFSSSQGFEKLLFKSVISRHARAVQITSSGANTVKRVVKPNNPRSLGDPDEPDVDAQNACFGAFYFFLD